MQKHFLRFSYLFTNIAFYPLILISNHSGLAAKYLQNDFEQSKTNLKIKNNNNNLFHGFDYMQEKKNIY